MTDEQIELCLQRLSTGKTSDVMNFSYADTLAYIERLKAENAELRERLGKFDDLHISMGDKIYIISNENQIVERFVCGVHVLSADIIFVTTIKQDYKPCREKGISKQIAHAFESCFGLIPLRDFGERAFICREAAEARLAELKERRK